MIKKEEFIERRTKIAAKLEDFSAMVLYSGIAKRESADNTYNFSVNRNFFYLTGIDQEDSILLIVKTPLETKEYLFIQPYDERKEKWTGIRIKDFEAKEISGIENIYFVDQFSAKLDLVINSLKNGEPNSIIYLDEDDEVKVAPNTTTKEVASIFINKYELQVKNIFDEIVRLRMVKSHDEIQEIKEAIKTTHFGLNAVLSHLEPNKREYQMKAVFEYTLRDVANADVSFQSICASGKNATILHYPSPTDLTHDGDLMLFDVGAQYNHYCGDISRTYPVNGKYNELQTSIYSLVLECNKHIIDIIRPDLTLADLQKETIEFLSNGLLKLKLIEKKEDYINYYFHNVSHHLGLDTHDVSFREIALQPGNIITVEPGLYIKELGIGIRIEDDVLVTNNGSMVLSIDIPKEIQEIESLMLTK
ncbi:MAG: Xaa-Pro peptidase family protein [Bacilli bacterium]